MRVVEEQRLVLRLRLMETAAVALSRCGCTTSHADCRRVLWARYAKLSTEGMTLFK